jgi:hypothetical protein
MSLKVFFLLFMALVAAAILTGCAGGSTITQQDLTNARQTAYTGGYDQGLEQGKAAGYSQGYSDGYTAGVNAVIAVWPAGSPRPVVPPPVTVSGQ